MKHGVNKKRTANETQDKNSSKRSWVQFRAPALRYAAPRLLSSFLSR